MTTSVSVRAEGRVTVVTIERPEKRNAVDLPTARALYDAFRRFDADGGADVAVLTGAGGAFCAGADLKALAAGETGPVRGDGRLRTDGADPPEARQTCDRGDRRAGGRRRDRACALVRSQDRGALGGVRRLQPPLRRAADRPRHHPPAAHRRARAGDGADPDRTAGRRGGGAAHRPRQRSDGGRRGARPGAGARPDAFRLSAERDAQRPAVGDRAVGSFRRGGGRQRGREGPRHAGERRSDRRPGKVRRRGGAAFAGGAGRHGTLAAARRAGAGRTAPCRRGR